MKGFSMIIQLASQANTAVQRKKGSRGITMEERGISAIQMY